MREFIAIDLNKNATLLKCRIVHMYYTASLTEKAVDFFMNFFLYLRMASKKIQSPRDACCCGVVTLIGKKRKKKTTTFI